MKLKDGVSGDEANDSRINDDAYEEIIDINEEADYAEAEDDADMDDGRFPSPESCMTLLTSKANLYSLFEPLLYTNHRGYTCVFSMIITC